MSSNLTRSTKFLKDLQNPPPLNLLNWVQTGSKTKLSRHGSHGIDGMLGALFPLSRDGDNASFPYTCKMGHRPHGPHRLPRPPRCSGTINTGGVVAMGASEAGFCASR